MGLCWGSDVFRGGDGRCGLDCEYIFVLFFRGVLFTTVGFLFWAFPVAVLLAFVVSRSRSTIFLLLTSIKLIEVRISNLFDQAVYSFVKRSCFLFHGRVFPGHESMVRVFQTQRVAHFSHSSCRVF